VLPGRRPALLLRMPTVRIGWMRLAHLAHTHLVVIYQARAWQTAAVTEPIFATCKIPHEPCWLPAV
jgi:hypothetical protein